MARLRYSKLSQERGSGTPFPHAENLIIKYETIKSESGQGVSDNLRNSCTKINEGDFF